MTTTNSYKDTKAVDYLEAIKRNQLESRNKKSSSSNFDMTYMLPMNSAIGISTSFTNTEKTIGDYDVVDNRSKLVCRLPLDYDVLDASNSNHGTVTGTETYVDHALEISSTHPLRKAFSFNGSSYITLANEGNFDFERTQPFSVSAWMKTTTSQSFVGFAAKNDAVIKGWTFGQNNTNPEVMLINSNNVNQIKVHTADNIADGNWHNVIMTYSGTSLGSGIKIYVDGISKTVIIDNDNLSLSILNNESVSIGALTAGGANKFTGQLDDVQIWNVELTATDVTDLYSGKQVNKDTPAKPAYLGSSDVA